MRDKLAGGASGRSDLSPCVLAAHEIERVFERGVWGVAGWRPGFALLTFLNRAQRIKLRALQVQIAHNALS